MEEYIMKKPVLVIMAAGMGSRYGGLKQIDPIDDQGHIIMDFSIFDAKRAGFEKVVFIIKKDDYLLTGSETNGISVPPDSSEYRLLCAYLNLSSDSRQQLFEYTEFLQDQDTKKGRMPK